MYNVNPATAKILMKMRKKEEGGLRRGEREKETFLKRKWRQSYADPLKPWLFIYYGEYFFII